MMEWISVKEQLPEDYVNVIVLLSVRGIIGISSIQKETVTAADQEMTTIRTWSDHENVQVTHWTPLPDLPKATP